MPRPWGEASKSRACTRQRKLSVLAKFGETTKMQGLIRIGNADLSQLAFLEVSNPNFPRDKFPAGAVT